MTDAIKGLVSFVEGLKCPACLGAKYISDRCPRCFDPAYEETGHPCAMRRDCTACRGTGQHLAARAALEAFARRAPLRDDHELFSLVTYTACVCDTEARDVLDALDDALLGPRGAGKGEG